MARFLVLGLSLVLVGVALTTPIKPAGEDVPTSPKPTPSGDNPCAGHPDGDFVEDKTNRAQYYECNGGKAFRFHCPATLVFKLSARGCVEDESNHGTHVPCTGNSKFDCTGKNDGFYPDSADKTRFHECDHGCPTDHQCPPTTYFEPSKNVCAFDDNAGHHTQAPLTHPPVITTEPTRIVTTEATTVPVTNHQTDAPTTVPTHHEETTPTSTPHFITPDPVQTTTRGRHGGDH